MDALEAAIVMWELVPAPKVVFLAGFDRAKMQSEFERCGAFAYLEKGTRPEDICSAVRLACSGEDLEAPRRHQSGSSVDRFTRWLEFSWKPSPARAFPSGSMI